MKLDNSQIKKITYSIDEIGSIFFFKNKILRAIKKESLTHINELLNCGLIDELVKKEYFPKTFITDYIIDGYALILEHEKLENWNHSYEWSFEMHKDVALSVIQINEISNRYGYELFDCHASNVIFKYNKPIYIDLGSFKKTNNIKVWSAESIFNSSFYIPLKLYSLGYANAAINISLSVEYYSEAEFMMINNRLFNIVGLNYVTKIQHFKHKINYIFKNDEGIIREKLNDKHIIYQIVILFFKKNFEFLSFNNEKARKKIKDLQMYKTSSMWGNYHDTVDAKESKRFNRIVEIINSFDDVESVMEFAANQGKLSSYLLANSKIKKVIATDYDINAVNTMYLKNKNTENFLPLLINFVKPEGRAFDSKIEERMNADVTISLAVTHHLLLTQNYDIDYIFKTILKFTNKYLLIEFMPVGLFGGDLKKTPKVPYYYNLEWFKENFLKYYDLVLDEELSYNRHLFVGSIKGTYK